MFFKKKFFFPKKIFLAKNPFWTFPMLFSQKKFFEKNFVFWKKYAKWRGHLDFWGIFLASECPELYKNAYMSPGRIKSVYSFNFRTLWSVYRYLKSSVNPPCCSKFVAFWTPWNVALFFSQLISKKRLRVSGGGRRNCPWLRVASLVFIQSSLNKSNLQITINFEIFK